METAFIFLQVLGILFAYDVSNRFPNMSRIQFLKVLFLSVTPTILYINLKYGGENNMRAMTTEFSEDHPIRVKAGL